MFNLKFEIFRKFQKQLFWQFQKNIWKISKKHYFGNFKKNEGFFLRGVFFLLEVFFFCFLFLSGRRRAGLQDQIQNTPALRGEHWRGGPRPLRDRNYAEARDTWRPTGVLTFNFFWNFQNNNFHFLKNLFWFFPFFLIFKKKWKFQKKTNFNFFLKFLEIFKKWICHFPIFFGN